MSLAVAQTKRYLQPARTKEFASAVTAGSRAFHLTLERSPLRVPMGGGVPPLHTQRKGGPLPFGRNFRKAASGFYICHRVKNYKH